MVTIKSADIKEVNSYFHKNFSEEYECFCARDKDQIIGFAIFSCENKFVIYEIFGDLFDGIARAVFNAALLRSIQYVFFDNSLKDQFIKRGYTQGEYVDVVELFSTKCQGEKFI